MADTVAPLSWPATPGGLEDAVGRSREPGELGDRTAWTSEELAATVGTLPAKDLIRAALAEGAFERADASLGRIGREVAVAALAVRA
jgi:hypothetical protein